MPSQSDSGLSGACLQIAQACGAFQHFSSSIGSYIGSPSEILTKPVLTRSMQAAQSMRCVHMVKFCLKIVGF